jgi:hypothetical protein
MRQWLSIWLVSCCTVSTAAAQGAIAVRVLSIRNVQPVHFLYNDDLRVSVKNGGSIPPAMHVRIFSGTKADLLLRRGDVAGCVEFQTNVSLVESSPGDQLFVAHLTSDWLEPSGGISNARYVLVFEEGTNFDGKLRVRQRDLKQYFKYGVEVQIDKGQFKPADLVQTIADISHVRSVVQAVPKPEQCTSVKESTAAVAMFVQSACPMQHQKNWITRLFTMSGSSTVG